MHVDVHEAWRDNEATSIYDARRTRSLETIEHADTAARDADVEAFARRTTAVDHIATRDEQVKVHGLGLELPALPFGQQLPRHPEITREQTAVDAEHGPCYPGGLVRGQEQGTIGNVVRLPNAPQRVPLDETLEHLRVTVHAFLPDGSPDGAWCDRIAPDSVLSVAHGDPLGEIDHAGLGRAVSLVAERRYPIDRGDVHDRSAPPVDHRGQHGFAAEEDALQHHCHVALPGGLIDLEHVVTVGDGRVVDQDI